MEFCFNIQGFPTPTLFRRRLNNSVPAFDTSKILIRPFLSGDGDFGVQDSALEIPQPYFEVKNESPLAVVFAYLRFSLAVPDARISAGAHYRNIRGFTLDSFLLYGHLGFLPGTNWSSRYATPIAVSGNGTYVGTLILEEVAGFAFDAGAMGIGSNINYASFATGPCVEAFKFAPALAIPFSGVVDYYP